MWVFLKESIADAGRKKPLAEFNYCGGGFEIKLKLLFYEKE